MDIVLDADISESRHEGILKFKSFESFSLLGEHKLQGIKNYCMDVVSFDAVDNGGDYFFDVGWAIEVHEKQGHLFELVSEVLKLIDIFCNI